MADLSDIQKRKNDHIDITLKKDVRSALSNGFDLFTFQHCALPEIDLAEVTINTVFLGFSMNAPIMISSMTGGTIEGDRINRNLAEAAQEMKIAMGVGSQRAQIESGDKPDSSQLRKIAPSIPLFANLGAVQLNYGFTIEECKKAVDLIEADGLILHLNPLQEALQKEGQTNFKGLSAKIEQVCSQIDVPVIVKEVGWGISASIARRLVDLGVAVIDVAGAGGTSWSEVEKYRASDKKFFEISSEYKDWGIPTAIAVRDVRNVLPDMPIIASGGLRNGMDLAKAIALGASIGGFAGRLLKAASESTDQVIALIDQISLELRITMFAAGAGNVKDLSNITLNYRE
jgi:isopentenyl-diphosphate delta-isomerase